MIVIKPQILRETEILVHHRRVYGINMDRPRKGPRLRVIANDDFDVRTRDLSTTAGCSNIAFSRHDRQGV